MTTDTRPDVQLPVCERCRSLPERVMDVDEIRRIPTLNSPDAVANYSGRSQEARETHVVDLPGLLATYDLGGPIEVSCSFPDHQPHLHGFMVETRCGLIVNIGHYCARNWVTNFDKVEGYQKKQKTAAAGRDALDGVPELLATVEAFVAAVPRLKEVKDNIRQDLPSLHQEMFSRAQAKSGGREVLIETRRQNADGETVVDQIRVELKGLSVWRIRGEEVEAVHSAIVNLKKEIDDLGQLGVADATRLSKWYSELREAVKVLGSEIEDGRNFFADDQNLAAAIHAAGLSDVTVRDREIVYEKGGRRYRLLSDGTRLPDTRG